jgi:hypothetical protein
VPAFVQLSLPRRIDADRSLRLGGLALLVVVISVLTWPVASVTPGAGLDPSWVVGLSLAISRGLTFGRQVVFAYGPLGLVAVPNAVSPGTLALGLLGAAAIQLALVAVILRALLRRFLWPIAALVTLLGVSIVVTARLPALDEIAFGLVAAALSAAPREVRRAARTLALAGGVLAGLTLLVKLNDGVAATAIVAVGLLGLDERRRHLALGAVTLVATTVIAWLALGQPLTALPDYFIRGWAIAEGYVDAMGINVVGPGGQWESLVMVVAAIGFGAAAWLSLADAPLRRRCALAVSVLIVFYFVAREMFIRYDGGHIAAMALLVAIPLLIPWRRGQLPASLSMTAGFAAVALAALGVAGVSLNSVFDLGGRTSALNSDLSTMFSPQATIASATAEIRATDAVPATIVADFNGRCVNAEPTEISAIFANPGWRWCPIGVLQSYAAYTPSLDHLDAGGYANARSGPDRVLRDVDTAIDGRNSNWDSPAAMLSLLCHFKQIAAGGEWQALERIPDRCGTPTLLATIHSGAADVAAIPPAPPGDVVIAEISGLQIHHRERLETLFVRAGARSLVINGQTTYRVVPDTLEDGLILDVPADADYSAPFNLNLAVRSIQAQIDQQPVAFTVRLLRVPIRPVRA